jgi:hypothetical protein
MGSNRRQKDSSWCQKGIIAFFRGKKGKKGMNGWNWRGMFEQEGTERGEQEKKNPGKKAEIERS